MTIFFHNFSSHCFPNDECAVSEHFSNIHFNNAIENYKYMYIYIIFEKMYK